MKRDRGGRDHMVVGFTTTFMQSVPITTEVVSSNPLFLVQSCTKFTFFIWIAQSNMAAMEGQDFSYILMI
jgi:hypothetical protein